LRRTPRGHRRIAMAQNPKYGSVNYWNEAFNKGGDFQEAFDWLASWSDLQKEIQSVLSKDARLLIPGCGNAPFQLDMYDAGYENLVCGDNSPVVIDQMKAACEASNRQIQWDLIDATCMPYESSSFEGVLDKALIDCLHCCKDSTQILRRYLDEVFRVLKPGGILVVVSFHSELSMKTVLRGRDWQISNLDTSPLLREGTDCITLSICVKGAAPGPSSVPVSASQKKNDRKKAQKLERRMMRVGLEETGLG